MSVSVAIAPFRDLAVPGVDIRVFEGGTDLPDGADEAELYVPPYDFALVHMEQMARMPKLRVVQTLTAGYEHVLPYLPAGVTLCNARGVHDASTAELAVGLMLASLRGIDEFARAQPSGEWLFAPRLSLADRTVLIVGHGSIGQALERRLAGFEVEVVRVARRPRAGVHTMAELPGLLPDADVVVLLVPLTPETERLVDAGFLARMHDGAVLVNVARGRVVDTDALLAELEAGRLRAALDVTEPEPLPAQHPLWRAPGCLISPHVGGATSAFLPRARRLVVEQLTRFVAGEPLRNVVVSR
ncbi:MAG: 2-hydroxyacid dehydrogenase [Streptosporangiales bacterium]|nr:2-hydroxyacid dehydrogenase [Streptosporangiales bacterium]MBO0892502.1 2-hydroxyacid dehydrogenase [Acidothermales bacterium]